MDIQRVLGYLSLTPTDPDHLPHYLPGSTLLPYLDRQLHFPVEINITAACLAIADVLR